MWDAKLDDFAYTIESEHDLQTDENKCLLLTEKINMRGIW